MPPDPPRLRARSAVLDFDSFPSDVKEQAALGAFPPEAHRAVRCGIGGPQLFRAIPRAEARSAFTESIDAKDGVTTGISVYDRAQTIKVAIDPSTRPNDLARPGHVFPLRARKGGVLVRAGQTEASVDLARLAGLVPAGVICEIMNDDGTMARVPELSEFCREHGLKMLTVAELIRYRMAHERYVRRLAEAIVPTAHGEFRMIAYESEINGDSHIALVRGDVEHLANSRCWCACTPTA